MKCTTNLTDYNLLVVLGWRITQVAQSEDWGATVPFSYTGRLGKRPIKYPISNWGAFGSENQPMKMVTDLPQPQSMSKGYLDMVHITQTGYCSLPLGYTFFNLNNDLSMLVVRQNLLLVAKFPKGNLFWVPFNLGDLYIVYYNWPKLFHGPTQESLHPIPWPSPSRTA